MCISTTDTLTRVDPRSVPLGGSVTFADFGGYASDGGSVASLHPSSGYAQQDRHPLASLFGHPFDAETVAQGIDPDNDVFGYVAYIGQRDRKGVDPSSIEALFVGLFGEEDEVLATEARYVRIR